LAARLAKWRTQDLVEALSEESAPHRADPNEFHGRADVVARYSLGLIGILEARRVFPQHVLLSLFFGVLGIVFLAASMKPIARYLESRAWVKKVNTGRLDNQDSVVREHTHGKDTGKIILWFTLGTAAAYQLLRRLSVDLYAATADALAQSEAWGNS